MKPPTLRRPPDHSPAVSRSMSEETLVEKLGRFMPENGIRTTEIPFVTLVRCDAATPMLHGVLRPSICLVIQGAKRRLIGKEFVRYGENHYVVASIDMPSSCQVFEASSESPYLGLAIDLDPEEIAMLAVQTGRTVGPREKTLPGVHVGETNAELNDALARLLRLLDHPHEIPFLAASIRHEFLYRLLASPSGPMIYRNLMPDRHGPGISKAVHWLKAHFAEPMVIEDLAREAGMSTTTLHRKFKAITTLSPLQYQKRLRLVEARRLLITTGSDAATAGFEVGYESPSQFSREYRRLFGAPPLQDAADASSPAMAPFWQD
ncbi:MAG: AraC family transcriptional regulator [Akkermansiaceae bacterium]|nr:AraC family transcriptional regulator [Akkermansiaceae bacterium]